MSESTRQSLMAVIRLGCALAASVAAMLGFALDYDAVFTVVMLVVAFVAMVWSWWKNNNITQAAQEAQKLLDELKAGSGEQSDDVGLSQ